MTEQVQQSEQADGQQPQPSKPRFKVSGDLVAWLLVALVAAFPLALSFFQVTNAWWSELAFAITVIVSFGLLVFGGPWWLRLSKGHRIAWCVYTLVASVTGLLGGRVERTEWYYTGNYEQNRMGEFVPADVFWVLAFALLVLALALSLLRGYDALVRLFEARGTHERKWFTFGKVPKGDKASKDDSSAEEGAVREGGQAAYEGSGKAEAQAASQAEHVIAIKAIMGIADGAPGATAGVAGEMGAAPGEVGAAPGEASGMPDVAVGAPGEASGGSEVAGTVEKSVSEVASKGEGDKADAPSGAGPAFGPLRGQAIVFVLAWAGLFLCWLPFFFTYYPGAIYHDSLSSIEQSLGMRSLTDHHPVAYTMMLGVFLRIGEALGSYQLGCAIYTICQMLFMSGSLAFLIVWLRRHRIPDAVLVFVWAYFALLRIFPLHAISMWKDALYATFLLLVAIALFDVVASRGRALARPGMLVRLAVLTFCVCLARNNGIYVMSACWLILTCVYGFRTFADRSSPASDPVSQEGPSAEASQAAQVATAALAAGTAQAGEGPTSPASLEQVPASPAAAPDAAAAPDSSAALAPSAARPKRNVAFVAVGAACVIAYLILSGPIYAALGIRHVPVESYAVPLQQASAVVVYEGTMTPEQSEFMNSLLPLDKYREEFLPCSVDGIKWAPDFDTAFFEEHRGEFLGIWAQMMLTNPKIYLDAYVLETYEYWTIGDIQRNAHVDGVNTKNEQEELGIVEENKLAEWFGEEAGKMFPFNFVYPCEGTIAWLLLFLALRQLLSGNPKFTLMLAPALLSWATLLISAPFAGLQRYALPSTFILPAAILLPFLVAYVCALWQRENATQESVD